MTDTLSAERCQAELWAPGTFTPIRRYCKIAAHFEEDGRRYCGIHLPANKARRAQENQAKYDAKMEARMKARAAPWERIRELEATIEALQRELTESRAEVTTLRTALEDVWEWALPPPDMPPSRNWVPGRRWVGERAADVLEALHVGQ